MTASLQKKKREPQDKLQFPSQREQQEEPLQKTERLKNVDDAGDDLKKERVDLCSRQMYLTNILWSFTSIYMGVINE